MRSDPLLVVARETFLWISFDRTLKIANEFQRSWFFHEIIVVRCMSSWKCVCVLGGGGSVVADLISDRLSHRYRR